MLAVRTRRNRSQGCALLGGAGGDVEPPGRNFIFLNCARLRILFTRVCVHGGDTRWLYFQIAYPRRLFRRLDKTGDNPSNRAGDTPRDEESEQGKSRNQDIRPRARCGCRVDRLAVRSFNGTN